jgi:tryptophan-rich sensory protein
MGIGSRADKVGCCNLAAVRAPRGDIMKDLPSLLAFMVLVLGGGLLIGYLTAPGEWYAALAKPVFTPPGWVFAPAWTVLYVLVAWVGWQTWRRNRAGSAMKLWWVQLGLNFAWSPLFFWAHQIGLAVAVIVLLLLAILGFIGVSWRQDRSAALLFLPYAAWVGFALALNGGILILN